MGDRMEIEFKDYSRRDVVLRSLADEGFIVQKKDKTIRDKDGKTHSTYLYVLYFWGDEDGQ